MTDLSKRAIVILTTTAGPTEAETLARLLVESGVAACVQVLDGAKSFYRWDSRIEFATESLILIKTTQDKYSTVEAEILLAHRDNGWYQTPEVLALPVTDGSPDYLRWLFESVRPRDGDEL